MYKLHKICALYFLGFLIVKKSTLINGQSSQFNGNPYNQCNQNSLQRCQQNLMGLVSQNFGGIANGLQNIGIPNGLQNNQLLQCSSLRRNLECVLIYTPLCQRSIISETNRNAELIPRAQNFLNRVCDDRSSGWKDRPSVISNQNIPFITPFNSFGVNNQNRLNGRFNLRNSNNMNGQFDPNSADGAGSQFGFSNSNSMNGGFGFSNSNGISGEFGASNGNQPYSQFGSTNQNSSPFNQLSTATKTGAYNQYGI